MFPAPIGSVCVSRNYESKTLREENPSLEPSPPVAKRIRAEFTAHGDTRIDHYHWFRDKNHPDSIRYFEEWNAYTAKMLEPLRPLTEQLNKEFISRIEHTYKSVPYKVGEYDYYHRMEEGKEYPIFCRFKEQEEIILDVNELAKEHEYVNIQTLEPSPDGKYVAFSIDTKGTQFGPIYIKDMSSGKFFDEEVLPLTGGDIEWTNDSRSIWYTSVDEEMRTDKIYFHRMGTHPENDLMVLSEINPEFSLGLTKDKLNRHIVISSGSKDTSEIFLADVDNPNVPLKGIQPRIKGIDCNFLAAENLGYFLISENRGNTFVQVSPIDDLNNREQITFGYHVEDLTLFKDYLAILKRKDGLLKIEVRSLLDGSTHDVVLPFEIGDIGFEYNEEYNTSFLRFTFESSVMPRTTYSYDMGKRTFEVLRQVKAGDFNPNLFTTERIWATADDGTQVPITLCYKKGMIRDGKTPMYLYAYGSYGVTIDPYFSNLKASLIERDVCWAIAHIRGGGDLGRQWYAEGCMMKKMNTFTDFINCAEHLIKQGYTSSDRLVIHGGSAGGLLMGAVINRRPDLFKACLAEVPFVDVLTTMFDETLPLTTQEWNEWGNPNDSAAYEYMKQYSPVDNVRSQNYPHLYITTGVNDAQVSCHEPAKWVAKLLEYKTDHNPILFEINMGAGHHGKSGRYAAYEEEAPRFAFLLNLLKGN